MSLLEDLFIAVVNMSITASCVAIGVILVRLLLKKAPKIFSYVLWAPVLFRLVCPFSFDSAFSLFNLINLNAKQGSGAYEFVPQNIGMIRTPVTQPAISSFDSAANASLPMADPVASADPVQIWLAVFSLIWIFGVIILLIYSAVSYVKTKVKLQTATRVDGNVFETDAIGTAFVCGFIRPKIYVPLNIGDADLSFILEHERTHIRRKDYLVKPLAFLALTIHWFNPLMWLCFSLMSRDMEMSCDESVLRKLGDGAKGGYSGSLLSLAVQRKGLLAANPLAFGENHIKTRIKNILNFRKPAFWVMVVAVMAVCAAVIAFAANPSANAAYKSEDYKVSLKYPSYWKSNPNYTERYEGKDGFFQVGAINGEDMSIDEVAENDAFHMLNPYGSDPKIIDRTIDGQEARLILPSADQPEEMKDQAGLIVKYPEAVKIGDSVYHYFILWADEVHIEQIGDTLTFLGNGSEQAVTTSTFTDQTAAAPSDLTPPAATSTDPQQTAAVPSDPTPPEYDPALYTPSVNEGQYELLVEVKPNVIPMHKIKLNRLYISITNLSEEEYRSRFLAHIEQFDGNDWVEIPGPGISLGRYPLTSLKKGETYELEERFSFKFTPGKYRLKVDDWYGEFEIVPSDPNMIAVEFDPNPITLEEFTDSGTLVTIRNLSDEVYSCGLGIDRLERFDGSEWVKVPWVEYANAVYLIQLNIEPGGARVVARLTADMFDYEFSPGKYRAKYDQWYGEFEII